MNKKRAIEILKNDCCYECSWGCRNPIECNNKECDYRQAIITAIDSLEREELSDDFKKTAWDIATENKTLRADNEWRTDTPKESGFYLVTNGANKLDIRKYDSGWYHDMYRRYTNEELKVVAWKKIEPYERKE